MRAPLCVHTTTLTNSQESWAQTCELRCGWPVSRSVRDGRAARVIAEVVANDRRCIPASPPGPSSLLLTIWHHRPDAAGLQLDLPSGGTVRLRGLGLRRRHSLAQPQTLPLQLTHFARWPRTDTFGERASCCRSSPLSLIGLRASNRLSVESSEAEYTMSLAPVLTRPPVGSPVAFCKHVRERGLWVSSSTLTAWISSTGDVASRHGAKVREAVGGHCCVSAVGDLA